MDNYMGNDEYELMMKQQEVLCRNIAFSLYHGDLRRGGEPTLCHLLRVAESFDPKDTGYRAPAWLHDAVEDGLISIVELQERGVHKDVLYFVEGLTKPANTSYEDYIRKMPKDCWPLKAADLADNLSDQPGKKRAKYIWALQHMAVHCL